MDKAQAIHNFWSGFGIPAYDENTVPTGDNAPAFPYITYSVSVDSLGNMISLSASVWYRSSSWESVSKKVEEISEFIYNQKSPIKIDGGYLWIVFGTPFAQRMSDPSDDMIRRIYVSVAAEFLTAY